VAIPQAEWRREAAGAQWRQQLARLTNPNVFPFTCKQAAATAHQLWSSMLADGVPPNGMAVAAFLEILLTEGEIDQALQVLLA